MEELEANSINEECAGNVVGKVTVDLSGNSKIFIFDMRISNVRYQCKKNTKHSITISLEQTSVKVEMEKENQILHSRKQLKFHTNCEAVGIIMEFCCSRTWPSNYCSIYCGE